MAQTPIRPKWSTSAKLLVSVGAIALCIYLLTRFSAVIPPLVIALIVAYVLSPLVSKIEAHIRIPRWAITLLVYGLLLGVVASLPALFIPTLVDQFNRLNINFQNIVQLVERFLGQEVVIGELRINGAQVVEQLVQAFQQLLEPVFGQTLSVAVDVITSFVWVVFILVISFYLVKDTDRLLGWIDGVAPPSYQEDYQRLKAEIVAIWAAFFRGQLTLALVVAAIFVVAGLVIGLPFTFAMALLAGLLEFLPSVGHGIWLTIASILVLFQGSTWIPLPNWAVMLLLIGLHVVFQQVDLNILIPRIIGRRVHLHPLVVILGIVAGASLAGVLGLLLAAPTIASARILGRYILANLFDADPFPSPPPEGITEDG